MNDGAFPRVREQGFSLLEILVAFAILALSLGVLLQIFSSGLRLAALSGEYSEAVLLAQSQLAVLEVEPELEPGEESGTFEHGGYRWRAIVEPYVWGEPAVLEQLPVRPLRMTVEVAWGEGGQERSVTLTTMRLVGRQ